MELRKGAESCPAFRGPRARRDPPPYGEESGVHFVGQVTWPRPGLPAPIRLRVIQDEYNLRGAPLADDTTQTESECQGTLRGNVVATFRLGTTAVALAQRQVGARIWYFLVTDPGSQFTTTFGLPPGARLAGWMRSRGAER